MKKKNLKVLSAIFSMFLVMGILLQSTCLFAAVNEEGKDSIATKMPPLNKVLTVSLDSVKGKPGDTVNVPIKLTDVPHDGIYGMKFNFKYDKNALNIVEIKREKLISDAYSFSTSDSAGGLCIVSLVALDGKKLVNKDGVLATIKIKIKDNAKGVYSIKCDADKCELFDKNYAEINTKFIDGSVTVVIPTPTPTKAPEEMFLNPSFDKDANNWLLWKENTANAVGVRDVVYYNSKPASYRIDCISQGSAFNHIQLLTAGLKLVAGEKYKLKFKAKSVGGVATPTLVLMSANAPWVAYSDFTMVKIEGDWATYEVNFKSNKTDNNGRLTFYLGGRMNNGSKLYLDSMSLKKVN